MSVFSFPKTGEAVEYFFRYINQVPDDEDIIEVLKYQERTTLAFLTSIPDDKGDYRYEEGKWSVKDVIQHVIDTERIFSFRGLLISRGEEQAIPGYDQDEYAENTDLDNRSLSELSRDFLAVRKSTISFYNSLSQKQSVRSGIASGGVMSVSATAYIIAGHLNHHEKVLKERYL